MLASPTTEVKLQARPEACRSPNSESVQQPRSRTPQPEQPEDLSAAKILLAVRRSAEVRGIREFEAAVLGLHGEDQGVAEDEEASLREIGGSFNRKPRHSTNPHAPKHSKHHPVDSLAKYGNAGGQGPRPQGTVSFKD